jgi:hypothetical protein
MQSAGQDVGSILLPVGGNIDLGEIQVKLGLAPVHPHGGVTKFFRLRPFLFRCGDSHAEIRYVKGIRGVLVKSGTKMRQRLMRIASAQIRQSSPKFLKSFNLNHRETLRRDVGMRLTSLPIRETVLREAAKTFMSKVRI